LGILEKISLIDNVSEISACVNRNQPFSSPDLLDSDRYLGILAQRYANAHNIKFKRIDTQVVPGLTTKNNCLLERFLTVPTAWNYFLIMKLYRNDKSVLIGDFSYNMDFLVEDIKKGLTQVRWILFRTRKKSIFAELIASFFWLILSILKKPFKVPTHKTSLHYAIPFHIFKRYFHSENQLDNDTNMNKAEDSIRNIFSKFHNNFLYRGVDFSDLLFDKIMFGILPFIKELRKDTAILYSLMKRIKPDFVISPVARNIHFSLGEVSKILNIPSLVISHASHIKPKNRLEEIEHNHLGKGLINTEYSITAIQSPHAKDYAKHFKIKSKLINTGPLLWGRANKNRREIYENLIGPYKEKRILLHAGTPKTRSGIRFHIYETLDEYVEGIKDIIEAIETMDDVILVIQFRPWSGLSLEDLKTLLPYSKKVFFSVATPFRDIISLADVLISFSSTTIEEALYNKVPVLLYGGGGRYMHLPAFEINNPASIKRSACYHVSRKALLHDALSNILAEYGKRKLSSEEDLSNYVFRDNQQQSIINFFKKEVKL